MSKNIKDPCCPEHTILLKREYNHKNKCKIIAVIGSSKQSQMGPGESMIEVLTWTEVRKPFWRKWWVSSNMKGEDELLGEEAAKCFPGRGHQCTVLPRNWKRATVSGKQRARNWGRWRLHPAALTLAWERHRINVNFPCLDFPLFFISKVIGKNGGKKVILFCWQRSINLIRLLCFPHNRKDIPLGKKGKGLGFRVQQWNIPQVSRRSHRWFLFYSRKRLLGMSATQLMAKGKKEPAVGTSHNRRTFGQQSHWLGTNLKGDNC